MKKGSGHPPSEQSEDATPPLGEVLDFMRLLWSIDHGLQTTSKRMEATIGITGLQRMVLRLVGRFPNISAGHLARILHVHPSTLTGVLKRLEDKQLVLRTSDPLDARKALFTLTPRGRQFDVPATGTVEASVQRALESVPQNRIAAARDVLRALSEALGTEPISLALHAHALARKVKRPRR